jgi:hypothetical protein
MFILGEDINSFSSVTRSSTKDKQLSVSSQFGVKLQQKRGWKIFYAYVLLNLNNDNYQRTSFSSFK